MCCCMLRINKFGANWGTVHIWQRQYFAFQPGLLKGLIIEEVIENIYRRYIKYSMNSS